MGFEKNMISAGSGANPSRGQTVTVHCTGIVKDSGKKFWSTKDDNTPFSFQIGMGKVIKGWDEGVATMKVGEKSVLTCSSDYAYGAKGFPAWGIPPNATLDFEIELLKVE